MGILTSLFRASAGEGGPSPVDDFWYHPIEEPSSAGMGVTPDSALRVAAVFACVRLISNTVASLPLYVYQHLDRGKQKAPEHPLWPILHSRPNRWQTDFEWKQMMTAHLALDGNGFSRILPGPRGAVDQLIPLHPRRVEVLRLANGRLAYDVARPDSFVKDRYTQDEIFHLRGFSLDGMRGISPISLAREAIGGSMAAQLYGGSLFKNGARPAGAIKSKKKLSDNAANNIRATWYGNHGGPGNAGRVALLEEDMDWVDVGMTSEDAQWIEFLKLGRSDIAMIYGIPPHMIGDVEKSTSWGAGIEEQGIGFVTYTLDSWVTLWEKAVDRDLIDDDAYFARFNVKKLLRGDIGRRYSAYSVGRLGGWLSVNDVREEEEMNPIDGGDTYLQPTNMAPVGAEADAAQPDPEDATDSTSDDTQPEDGPAATAPASGFQASLGILLRDAAERCAAAEVRGLEKRAAKAADNPERWNAWLAEYYEQHCRYVTRALQPIADAWAMQGGMRVDVQRAGDFLAGWARPALGADVAAAVVEGWKTARAGEVAAMFEAAFGLEVCSA